MMGKITSILARKEAETYREQGLHQEAIRLFDDLLNSPGVDPAIKNALRKQIEGIENDMQNVETQQQRSLTATEIARIRDGWGEAAGETDILVCAQAFFQIDAFHEALKEFIRLIKKAGIKRLYVHSVADCLVKLCKPQAASDAAVKLAAQMIEDGRKQQAVLLGMAKRMHSEGYSEHALALFDYLKRFSKMAAEAVKRMADIKPAGNAEASSYDAVPSTAVEAKQTFWVKLRGIFHKDSPATS